MSTQNESLKTSTSFEPYLGAMCRPAECYYAAQLRQEKAYNARLKLQLEQRDCRIRELEKELERTNALLRSRENKLFGRKSEKTEPKDKTDDTAGAIRRKRRGARPGHRGHGRKLPRNIPVVEQIHRVPPQDAVCPKCGKPYSKSGLHEESHEVTIEIQFRLIKHKRERVFCDCGCSGVPASVTAPLPPKVIPKGMYSHAFLAHLLTYKYGFQIPLTRIALMFAMEGLQINPGTVCNTFMKLRRVLHPLYMLFRQKLLEERKLHVDETSFRRFGFTQVEGKPRKLHWLWTFSGEKTVFFWVDPSRSSSVLHETLGSEADLTLLSDHFSAYKKYARESNVVHALCWGHFRRFFKDAMTSYRSLKKWCEQWISRIGQIYHLNEQRLKALGDKEAFTAAQENLEDGVAKFRADIDAQLKDRNLHEKQFGILTSAVHNWKGYTVFVKDYRIPMDNNAAERALRPGALGRKNWYGAHADWSGSFAGMMMTFIQTAIKHGLNPTAYIHYLLDRLAGKPQHLKELLPWNIPQEHKNQYKMERGNSP